jgi:hypothetical protein
MTQATENYYEVSADWLKACGLGNGEAAQTFPVVRSYMAGHLPMVVVRLDNGREWEVIASWRGRYVAKPEAPAPEPMVSKADAESLAIYYSAFCERPLDDDDAMIVWGGGLLALQEKTGIELQRTSELRRIVERAFRNKERKAA